MTAQSVTIHRVPQIGLVSVEPRIEIGLMVEPEYVTLHCPPATGKPIEENALHYPWSVMLTPMAAREMATALATAADLMEDLQDMKIALGKITRGEDHATE